MFDLDTITLGYYISAALFTFGASLMLFGHWCRKKASQTPVVTLSQQIPKMDGLCETTVWVANPTPKNVYIRNFILQSGTFASDEIQNASGQIVGYRKGYSAFRSASYTVPSGTETDTFIAFHVKDNTPIAAQLVGKKGVYDIHFSQPKPKTSLITFWDNQRMIPPTPISENTPADHAQ